MNLRILFIILIIMILIIGCVQNRFDDFAAAKNFGYGYYKQKSNIYFRQRNYVGPYTSNLYFPELFNVHSRSFRVLENYFAKDKHNIYYCAKTIENADKETFQVLKVSTPIPYFTERFPNSRSCFGQSPKNHILTRTEFYAKDINNVYYGENKIYEAQPQNYQLLSILYSKDANNVFFKDQLISNADTESFKVIAGNLAKDKSSVFYSGKIVASSENFNLVNEHYFCNENHVYYSSSLLNFYIVEVDTLHNLNPKNFEILGDYAKDNKSVYFKGKLVEKEM